MQFPYVDDLTMGERHLIDWQFGWSGSFMAALWSAIAQADEQNLARLALAFPEDVEAFIRFSREEGYWDALQLLAKFGNKGPTDDEAK